MGQKEDEGTVVGDSTEQERECLLLCAKNRSQPSNTNNETEKKERDGSSQLSLKIRRRRLPSRASSIHSALLAANGPDM